MQHKNKRILIEFIRKSSAEEFYAHISESAECPVRLITGDSSIQERKDIIADIENMQEVIINSGFHLKEEVYINVRDRGHEHAKIKNQ